MLSFRFANVTSLAKGFPTKYSSYCKEIIASGLKTSYLHVSFPYKLSQFLNKYFKNLLRRIKSVFIIKNSLFHMSQKPLLSKNYNCYNTLNFGRGRNRGSLLVQNLLNLERGSAGTISFSCFTKEVQPFPC